VAVLLTLILLAVVIAVVSAPLLRTRKTAEPETARHAELSAAREAKYREIRDAELDYKTGKLSQADYDAINADLRAEAVEILDQLEALDAPPPASG
jgi:type II secretory pathway component PulM